MKLADISDMELGNALFGNSRGTYAVVPRKDYQDVFCDFLYDNGFDMYGNKYQLPYNTSYANGVFTIRPYYWGDDEIIARLPNFEYKPTGLKIRWYKYPMRDAYSNQDVDVDTFKKILKNCAESMRE